MIIINDDLPLPAPFRVGTSTFPIVIPIASGVTPIPLTPTRLLVIEYACDILAQGTLASGFDSMVGTFAVLGGSPPVIVPAALGAVNEIILSIDANGDLAIGVMAGMVSGVFDAIFTIRRMRLVGTQ